MRRGLFKVGLRGERKRSKAKIKGVGTNREQKRARRRHDFATSGVKRISARNTTNSASGPDTKAEGKRKTPGGKEEKIRAKN